MEKLKRLQAGEDVEDLLAEIGRKTDRFPLNIQRASTTVSL